MSNLKSLILKKAKCSYIREDGSSIRIRWGCWVRLIIASGDGTPNHHLKTTILDGLSPIKKVRTDCFALCCQLIYTCMQKWKATWCHPHACKYEIKDVITIKSNIQIKFGLHYNLSYDKIFKTRPHLAMFAWSFKNYFFNTQ